MAEMSFWDHLEELRRVLFRVIGVWMVLAAGYFVAMPYLFDHVILAPCHNDFIFYDFLRYIGRTLDLTDEFFTQEFHVKLVNINLAAPFFIHISTAFWLSVVTTMPYLLYEVWRFIAPALYPDEKKGVSKALGVGAANTPFPFHLSAECGGGEHLVAQFVYRQFHDAHPLHGAGF